MVTNPSVRRLLHSLKRKRIKIDNLMFQFQTQRIPELSFWHKLKPPFHPQHILGLQMGPKHKARETVVKLGELGARSDVQQP